MNAHTTHVKEGTPLTKTWDKLDQTSIPALATITTYVDSPLWDDFLAYMQDTYKAQPTIEYSGCGMMPGWNVKFRKAGKGLCTLYPDKGRFTVLVVIGQKEKAETELALPTFSAYTRKLYADTKEGMGQRWLMFDITDAAVLADAKACIAIRRRMK